MPNDIEIEETERGVYVVDDEEYDDFDNAVDALASEDVDEELGEVDGFGYYALLLGVRVKYLNERPKTVSFIVMTDSQGFHDATEYESESAAREAWRRLEQEESDFYDDDQRHD